MKKIFLVFALSFLMVPFVSFAADFESGQVYALGKDAVAAKNLYAAGNNVNIMGMAKADVFTVGGTIMVTGNVANDLNAAGGTLIVETSVGDDVRLVGGTVMIGGKIGGELLAAGGQVSLKSNLKIDGDTVVAGGNISIDGNMAGDLSVYGDTVRIDGKVKGDILAKTGGKLIIGSGAEIGGDLNYSAPEKLTIEDGAKISGKVNFKEIVPAQNQQAVKKGFMGFLGASWLIMLLISLTASLVAYFVLGKKLEEAINHTLDNFGKETLRGFILLVVLPIAVIISFITIIGILLGVAGILLYSVMALFASVFAPIVLGTIIFRKLLKKPEFGANWKSVTTGVVVMKIVNIIPFIGWIFSFVFFLAAFGMLFNYLYRNFKKA
ncbi:MAG: polymer-forming cytoskeletal protein [Candidatus Paceibacterota bacterium]